MNSATRPTAIVFGLPSISAATSIVTTPRVHPDRCFGSEIGCRRTQIAEVEFQLFEPSFYPRLSLHIIHELYQNAIYIESASLNYCPGVEDEATAGIAGL